MKIAKITAALAAVACLSAGSAQAAYYDVNFDAGKPSEFSGGNLVSVQGFNGIGNAGNTFTGNYLRSNGTVSLTLNNLPTHTGISLSFLLAVLDSWDGPAGFNCCGPDVFKVSVDGTQVFNNTFNIFGHSGTDYNAPSGGQLAYGSNYAATSYWVDQAFDMGLDAAFQSIAHTGKTLTITWQQLYSQGYDDESFALDNVRINLLGEPKPNKVPEPASLALAGLGLAGLGFARKRKAAKAS